MTGCLYFIFVRPFALLFHAVWDLINLVPYVLMLLGLWLMISYFVWGTLSVPGLGSLSAWFDQIPVVTQTSPGPTPSGTSTESFAIVFRFLWQGESIYYLGNEISEDYFEELARQAKDLNGKVEVQQASNVTVETADRRRAMLDEIGVAYEIIPV